MRWAAVGLVMVLAQPARAGPWPQEDGGLFLSFGGNVALFDHATRPVHYDPTFYLEYGLTPRLTLGLDGYTADVGSIGSGFAFARYALPDGDNPDRWALALGLGATLIPETGVDPAVRFGAHWGRGLDRGWLALDAEAVRRLDGPPESKIDATWGWRFADDWSTILTMQAGIGLHGDLYAKVTPSVQWQATESISLRGGLVHALTGDGGTGLMLQVWTQF